jgi:hypothetical protein
MKIRYLARAIAKRIAPFDLRTGAFTLAANAAAKRRNLADFVAEVRCKLFWSVIPSL